VRATFCGTWRHAEAEALHVEIESAAAGADGSVLGELLLELSVFLCAFVDSDDAPSHAVQARIDAMCVDVEARLRPTGSSSGAGVVSELEAAAPTGRNDSVLLLVDPQNSDYLLAKEVGQRKLSVAQVDSLPALAAELARRPVSVVAMHTAWVDRAAEVVAAIERAHPHSLTAPGILAQIEVGNRPKRMFALRAGVDQVVEAQTAPALADAIAGFVARRLHSAFRVLIVEDDRGQAMFAQKVLGHRGMLTQVAASAAEALAVVEQFGPDLCLLDLNLPDRNGIELAQLLRDRPGFEFVQIVFLTGEISADARTLAVRLGADDWIIKPVRPRDLLTVVETRAERARRTLLHDSASKLGREAARGVQSRMRVLGAIESAISAQKDESHSVLVAIAPHIEGDTAEVSWLHQAELGGELARALRAHRLVRSEVCQAETLCSLFVAEPAVGNQQALAAIATELERRQWLTGSDSVQLPFVVVGLQLERTMTAEQAVNQVQALLRKAQQQAPRVRFQASESTSTQPRGWPQLREIFASDALGRSHRISFSPLLPLAGGESGQFLLRAEFEVRLDLGESCIPDHRAFARHAGFHQRLDQWLLARCFDRLRLDRSGLRFAVELCPETIEDPAFAEWMRSELQRRRLESPRITLWLQADRLQESAALAAAQLRALTTLGVRVALGPLTDSAADLRLARLEEVHSVICVAGEGGAPLPAELLKAAQANGKFVIVTEVDDPQEAESMFRQPVHYLTGGALSPPLSRPEFEFPE